MTARSAAMGAGDRERAARALVRAGRALQPMINAPAMKAWRDFCAALDVAAEALGEAEEAAGT